MNSRLESIGDRYESAYSKTIHNLEIIYVFTSMGVNSVVG